MSKKSKNLQENLSEEMQLMLLSLDRSGDPIVWVGSDACILYANEAVCKSLGYSRDELLSMTVFDVDPMITEEKWSELMIMLKEQGTITLESQHKRKDGQAYPVEVTANYLEHEGKEILCAFARDMSARKRSEQIQSSVYEISEAAHSAQSLDELFGLIHEIITELMPAKNNFYIALYDEDAQLLSFPYFVDEYDEPPEPEPLGRGLTEYVLRTGEPLLASPEVFAELEKKGEVESIGPPSIDWLGVPLKVSGKTFGVLVVQTYTEGFRYTEEEKDILMFISEQAAMAITRTQAEEALRESEQLFRSVVEYSPNGIFIIDDNYRPEYGSDQLYKIIGYTPEEFIDKDFRSMLDDATLDLISDRYRRRQRGEEVPSRYEFDFTTKDGKKKRLELSSSVIQDSKQRVKTVAQVRDVTEQRENEEKIKSSLKEKEVLLREIHHRVKNNLQIISSLLNLQSEHVQDEKALEMFKESRLRVRSMAMVHEKLYRSTDLASIHFGDYIHSLVYHLFQIYGVTPETIKLNVDVQGIFLDINTAIPCGLLVSELISNSLKHAFPEGRKGEVKVQMSPVEDEKIKLVVSDNGIGIKDGMDLKSSSSFGLQLVDMLSEQLQGKVEVERNGGTTFSIVFKEIKF